MRNIRYGIHVTSWRGSLGVAIHYYGKVWRENIGVPHNNPRRDEWDDPPVAGDTEVRYWEGKLHRVLTKREAQEMNDKDDATTYIGSSGLKSGDTTYRFDHEEDAITAGVDYLTRLYGRNIAIEIGDHVGHDNYSIPVFDVEDIAERVEAAAEGVERSPSERDEPCPTKVYEAVRHQSAIVRRKWLRDEKHKRIQNEEEHLARMEARRAIREAEASDA